MAENIKFLVNPSIPNIEQKSDNQGFQAKYQIPDDIDVDSKRIKVLIESLLESTENIQPENDRAFNIDEIELNIGVNAKGKLGILSFGVEAGGQAGIKIKLKRNSK
jgi:hypothetical protein